MIRATAVARGLGDELAAAAARSGVALGGSVGPGGADGSAIDGWGAPNPDRRGDGEGGATLVGTAVLGTGWIDT